MTRVCFRFLMYILLSGERYYYSSIIVGPGAHLDFKAHLEGER